MHYIERDGDGLADGDGDAGSATTSSNVDEYLFQEEPPREAHEHADAEDV